MLWICCQSAPFTPDGVFQHDERLQAVIGAPICSQLSGEGLVRFVAHQEKLSLVDLREMHG
jgi:hypothetical protein